MLSSKQTTNPTLLVLWTFLSIAVLSPWVSAMPASAFTARGDDKPTKDAPKSAQKEMQNVLNTFFALHNVKAPSFFALDGWQTIDFAGANTVSEYDANNIIFHTLDKVQDRYKNNTQKANTASFSQGYTTWIQELSKALGINEDGIKQSQVIQAGDASHGACMQKNMVLQQLLQEWKNTGGVPVQGTRDKKFKSWAEGDSRYQTVSWDCQQKTKAYRDLLSEFNGDSAAVFAAAENNIDPLINPRSSPSPGITLPVAGGSDAPDTETTAGNTVAYYAIPSLNMTLVDWQKGKELQPFSSTGNQANSSSTKESSKTSAGLGLEFFWEGIPVGGVGTQGSTEKSKSVANVSAQSFDFKFGSIALMDIDMGLWNDLGASADAVLHASDGDPAKSPKVKKVFDQYIGSEKDPGPAAVWNDKALVVYQPSIEMTFSSEDAYDEAQRSSSSASGCFLFICISGGKDKMKHMTSSSKTDKKMSFKDTSKNAYIVGFVQTSFWASKSGEDNGGSKWRK
ncbi:hypothetical protein VKT23_004904 [Stygiomarasmius scandens]|uniref:Uncharacterized protein n=1 Tax=Marasmiellus scandens TaxID=2682957 RepID=A0ABR1JY19_9AGAR